MDDPRKSLTELVSLSESIARQEQLNAANISSFFETLERVFREEIRLSEEVWIDQPIWEDSATIFGWCQVESGWHIAVGERETWVDPDGETVTYASSTKKVLDCDKGVQMQVLRQVKLLIEGIHRHLRARHDRTQTSSQEIIKQIETVAQLLGGELRGIGTET